MPKTKRHREEAEPVAAAPAAQRRRSARVSPPTAAEKAAESQGEDLEPFHAAAAEDSGGGSSSDGEAYQPTSGPEEDPSDPGVAEEASDASEEAQKKGGKDGKSYLGVYPERRVYGKAVFRVRVRMPAEVGGKQGRLQELGTHSNRELAARVRDRALIAIQGRKVAAPVLNFPLSHYPEQQEHQRFGPELNAYLLQLSTRDGRDSSSEDEPKKKGPRPFKGATGQEANNLRRQLLQKALDVRGVKLGQGSAHAEAVVAERRAADPLWVPPRVACGLCPACRQPWRTDLGLCVRLAAMKSAGHKEQHIVQLLASDRNYVAAMEAEQQQQEQEGRQSSAAKQQQTKQQKQKAEQKQQQKEKQQQQKQYAKHGARDGDAASPPLPDDLLWLEQPAKRSAGTNRPIVKLQSEAMAPHRQQLAWDQSQFAAALQQERQQGVPRPVVRQANTVAATSRSKRRGGGGSSSGGGTSGGGGGDSAAAPSTAAAAGSQGPAAVEPSLLNPFSWMARAQAPKDTIGAEGDAQDLVQLAALCREGDLEVPLSVGQAEEALEEEEAARESMQLVLKRQLRLQRQEQRQGRVRGHLEDETGADDGDDGDGAAEAEVGEGEGPGPCLLCGSQRHGSDMRRCPVMQMALAVPKPPEVCPGCADQEVPGCRLCLQRSSRLALAQPLVQRAPWMAQLAPATRQLMLAAQEMANAAVTDLDATGAAYRCTPKALLAVGLLAEEAARREVGARFGGGGEAAAPALGG